MALEVKPLEGSNNYRQSKHVLFTPLPLRAMMLGNTGQGCLLEQRVQFLFQFIPSSKNAAADRSQRNVRELSDFFVRQTFQLPQNQRPNYERYQAGPPRA